MQPSENQVALVAEIVSALSLPGTTTTVNDNQTGFEISVAHCEYALPVVKFEHLETESSGPAAHQAGWTMTRVVVDRRHAKRAESVLTRHGYGFKGMGYAGYAVFTKRIDNDPQVDRGDPPPWNTTAHDQATLECVAAVLTTEVEIVRRQTEQGSVLELISANVPVPLDPMLIVSRMWDPDSRAVVALAAVDVAYSRWIEPVLLERGYERLARVPGGPQMLVCRTTAA